MSKKSGALGFAGGFARGFANTYASNKENARKEAREAEDRKYREYQTLAPLRLKHAEETGDWAGYQEWLGGYFPDLQKELKKGGGSPFEHLAPLLQAAPKPSADQGMMQAEQGSAVAAGLGQQDVPVLPSRQAVQPQTPPAPPDPKSLLFGSPMPTREQRVLRDAELEAKGDTVKSAAQMSARRKIAAELNLDPDEAARYIATGQMAAAKPSRYASAPADSTIYSVDTGETVKEGTPKATQLTGALGERTREIMALNPDLDEPTARAQAAKAIQQDRDADQTSQMASAESLRANRAIQQTLLQMQSAQGGITPNNAVGLTTQLRRDWTKAVAPYRERQTYIAKLDEGIRQVTTKAGVDGKPDPNYRITAAQTIVNSFNRVLEETNTVREGEYARSEDMVPIVSKLEALIARVTTGGNTLTDAQLLSIAREGKALAATVGAVHAEGLKDLRTAMTSQLGRYKLPPEDVFGPSKIGTDPFIVTFNGKTITFPSQSAMDVFKRRYPDAK